MCQFLKTLIWLILIFIMAWPSIIGDEKYQLRNLLDQVGIWGHLWGILLVVNQNHTVSYLTVVSILLRLVILAYIRKLSEWLIDLASLWFSHSQQVLVTVWLLIFTPVARFLFIHSFIFKTTTNININIKYNKIQQ